MKKIHELFIVKYGVNLELNALSLCDKNNKNSVNFVSRTTMNNGVSAIVERIAGIEPLPAGTITVAGGGSVLETFLQPEPYYSGRDLYYLTPRFEMSEEVKLFYCACIRANKYKYNYGRQANKTLKDILIPDIAEIPKWVYAEKVPSYQKLNAKMSENKMNFDLGTWQPFKYKDVFKITRGESLYLQDMEKGEYPYVSATSGNNGISAFVDTYNSLGNTIVLNYDGSIGEAFYHQHPYFASEKVVTIKLKNHSMNKYIAMFLITLIRQEKFRYNYGLKWSVNSRMKESIIKLPVTSNGTPDYDFMENYIKSLPYSASI